MAGLIRRADIDAVRERARIDEVVGAHVTLRSAGVGSMKGLCPFHDEKTPSFHVRPQLGLWHCFGCDEGGDVISFVQRIEHLPFTEAVESLAAKYGVQLTYEDSGRGGGGPRTQEEPGRRQRLLAAHTVAEEFYVEQLATARAATARRFLAERGFDAAAAARFGVGYAPAGWDHLLRHLRGRGFTEAELTLSGLASQGSRGVYDRFRGRLVWPIRDITGATVGFGARKLDEDDQGPKYLNTPETPLYKKSQVLYGIDLAKKDIARSKQVVIVEGYTDVMAAHLAGVPTAVATCGTAFGADHARVVRRLLGDGSDPTAGLLLAGGTRGGEVIFTFDGDAAGQKAALRAFGEDQRFSAQTFVAVGPQGLDPCDLRLQRGDQAVRDLVAAREPLFAFVIRAALASVDLDTVEGRVAGLRAAAPVVATIRDRALREGYARELAGWLGMNEAEVRRAVARAPRLRPPQERDVGRQGVARGDQGRGGGGPAAGGGDHYDAPEDDRGADPRRGGGGYAGSGRPVAVPGGGRHDDPVVRLERQALQVVLQFPGVAHHAGFDELGPDTFGVPLFRAVHDAIRAAGGTAAAGPTVPGADGAGGAGASGAGIRAEDAEAAATNHWVETVRESAVEPVAHAVTELAVAPLPEDRPAAVAAFGRGVLASLGRLHLTRQIGEVKGRLGRMEATDRDYPQVFAELLGLESRRRALEDVTT